MNACEAEILTLTKYQPKKKYRDHQEYLICLLRELDRLPDDKFDHLVSHQVYDWYKTAFRHFRNRRDLPELPDVPVEGLRYPRDDEGYVPPAEPISDPETHSADVRAMIEARQEADVALDKLQEATEKVKPKRVSKYRQAHPTEGARHYLFPEHDRFGLLMGGKRQQAAAMFERGANMSEVKAALGSTQYNLLKQLRGQGHRITNSGGLIKLTHKDDLEVKV